MDKARIADALGLPRSTLTGELRLHFDGNSRLVIEGHRGLQEYAPERIRLRGRRLCLEVLGRELALESISVEDMVVVGEIDSVGFEQG